MDDEYATKISAAFNAYQDTLEAFVHKDIGIIAILLTPIGIGHTVEIVSNLDEDSLHRVLHELKQTETSKIILPASDARH